MSEQEQQDGPDTRWRLSEAVESLDGFERIAIGDHFTRDLEELGGTRLVVGVIAVLLKRDGMSLRDAFPAAKALTLKQVNDYFAPEAVEPVADLDGESEVDDTPAGKGWRASGIGTAPTPGSPWPPDSRSPQMSTSG